MDLTGWELKDSGNTWVFPTSAQISPPGDPTLYEDLLILAPGEYLVVMASDKGDPTEINPVTSLPYTNTEGYYLDASGYLHANFKLSGGGEYVGLYDDASVMVHEYAPYPEQTADISYGIAQDLDITEFVSVGDDAQYIIPTEAQGNWTSTTFDDTWWETGDTAIGYADTVPGFAVWNYKANTAVGGLDAALSVLDTPSTWSYVNSENIDTIDYYNSGGHGH